MGNVRICPVIAFFIMAAAAAEATEEPTQELTTEQIQSVLARDRSSVPHYSDLHWRLEVPVFLFFFAVPFLVILFIRLPNFR